MIRGISINCDDAGISGRLDRLEKQLERAQHAGFDGYELSLESCNIIRCGHLVQDELDRVKKIMARYPLHYTVHPPCNLQLVDRSGFQRQVFLSCLDATAQIGADVMVYHSAQIALRAADQDTAPLPNAAGLQEMWQIETAQLMEMAHRAADRGVTIAVENRDPHLWEVAALHRHRKRPGDLVTYHQGMCLDLIARQVAEVNSAHVGICLDTGHAFLAAPYWPDTDYLGAIRQAAPYIRHVHFHDNFGRLDDTAESIAERAVFGEADSHMPPGWGAIPLPEVLSILKQAGYDGRLTVELRSRYMDDLSAIVPTVRTMLGRA